MISQLALVAKKVVEAAWLHGPAYDLATQAVTVLESAQLLQSPETADELDRLRTELAQRTQDLADTHADRERLRARVAASEQEKSSPSVADATPAFFQPGRAYTRNLPFRAPEDRPNFECVGTGAHPTKGSLRAFGFEQPGAGRPWVSAAQRVEEWEEGWVDLGPIQPDRLTQTFAPTQTLGGDNDA